MLFVACCLLPVLLFMLVFCYMFIVDIFLVNLLNLNSQIWALDMRLRELKFIRPRFNDKGIGIVRWELGQNLTIRASE
jgi:hypothetical protein